MCGVYTTINPETGDFTEERDFVNSWKWKYNSVMEAGYQNSKSTDLNIDRSTRRALISKYWLNDDTPEDVVHRFHKLSEEKNEVLNKFHSEQGKVRELFSALETSVISYKDIKKELSSRTRQNKKLKKEIISFLSHKEDCLIFSLEILGRIKQKAECTCGLKDILNKI
jgi:hypothetical protein